MLTNIPFAKFYSIASTENPVSPIAVGDMNDMDYVADLLHDNQLVLETGISDEECFLLFNISWEELANIVDTAKGNKLNAQDPKTD